MGLKSLKWTKFNVVNTANPIKPIIFIEILMCNVLSSPLFFIGLVGFLWRKKQNKGIDPRIKKYSR